MPLGYFAMQSLRARPRLEHVLLLAFAGMAVSAALELTQYYDAGRQTTVWDILANTLGTLSGALAGAALHHRMNWAPAAVLKQRPYLTLLLACWFGYRLYPYVPVIDLHAYWSAVRPLIHIRELPLMDACRHAVLWLSLALMLEALVGRVWSSLLLMLLLCFVEGARVLIGTRLSAPEIVGGALAVLVWTALLVWLPRRGALVALLFTAMVILQALEPFRIQWPAHHFQWIPFYGFLHGSIAVNVTSFFEKAFTYGALVWLAVRAGLSFRSAVWGGAALVFFLRLCQIYVPRRSAEITDVLILLAMAGLMKVLRENAARL
jgi:VanZ family protein